MSAVKARIPAAAPAQCRCAASPVQRSGSSTAAASTAAGAKSADAPHPDANAPIAAPKA
jgi:hypothetical protein